MSCRQGTYKGCRFGALEAMPEDQIDTADIPQEILDWSDARRGPASYRPVKFADHTEDRRGHHSLVSRPRPLKDAVTMTDIEWSPA